MCGLVYIKRFDGRPASKMVEKRYKAQKKRGSDGFGYFALDKGKLVKYSRASKESDIIKDLGEQTAEEIVFHHRFPTSAPNFPETAHPISIKAPFLEFDYLIVHNGVVQNDLVLKEQFEKLGYKYSTEVTQEWRHDGEIITQDSEWNDSESLGIDMAMAIEGKKESIKSLGSVAFIMLQLLKGTNVGKKLFWGRNWNPLKMETVKGHFVSLTSEGNGKDVSAHTLYSMDYETYEVEEKEFSIGYNHSYKKDEVTRAIDKIWPEKENRDYNYHSHSYDHISDAIDRAGYDTTRTKRLPAANIEDDDAFDDGYYFLLEERSDLEVELSDPRTTDVEREKIEDRIVVIKSHLKEYEAEEVRRAAGLNG